MNISNVNVVILSILQKVYVKDVMEENIIENVKKSKNIE